MSMPPEAGGAPNGAAGFRAGELGKTIPPPDMLRVPQGLLKGKFAIFTGVSRPNGIGAASVRRFGDEGLAGIVISSTKNTEEMARQRVDELREKGVDAEWVGGDISRPETAEEIVEVAKRKFGKVDILVHNAGAKADGPLNAITEEEFDHVMGVNAKGAFFLAQKTFPLLRHGGGSIILIGSPAGVYGSRGQAAYVMAKAAEMALVRALVIEFAGRNIRANGVLPGLTAETDMADVDEKMQQIVKDITPLRELPTVEQSANAILFFASPLSEGINGQILEVGGGLDGGIIAVPALIQGNYGPLPRERRSRE